ncbi:FCD domain-containing protein [Arthrobacter sp.]|uniref:GntR family transcriptional regulator n=1 Tax=Arthrobacter sp. TaxID=1667 RepID=UPI00339615A6
MSLTATTATTANGFNAETTYQRLREQIVGSERMPNERLVEVDLANDFSVSRTVVRTVLTRLEQEGLVVREPNRGARVRMVTEAEAVEILQARCALETLAAFHAALNATPEDIEELRKIMDEASGLLGRGNLLNYSDCNARLHDKIVEVSGHKIAGSLISGLRAQLVRFQFKTILVPGRDVHAFAEHSAVVDAIADKDPERAERAMKAHMGHITEAIGKTDLARNQRSSP